MGIGLDFAVITTTSTTTGRKGRKNNSLNGSHSQDCGVATH